jgi:hypothetical protein
MKTAEPGLHARAVFRPRPHFAYNNPIAARRGAVPQTPIPGVAIPTVLLRSPRPARPALV